MKVMFNTKVKYAGIYFPANEPFEIEEKDKDELVKIGAIVVEGKIDKEEPIEVKEEVVEEVIEEAKEEVVKEVEEEKVVKKAVKKQPAKKKRG